MRLIAGLLLLLYAGPLGCGPAAPPTPLEQAVREALHELGLDESALQVPHMEDTPRYARAGRLAAVDAFMTQPLRLLSVSRALASEPASAGPAGAIVHALGALGVEAKLPQPEKLEAADAWALLVQAAGEAEQALEPPSRWSDQRPFFVALRAILVEMARARMAWHQAVPAPEPEEIAALTDDLRRAIATADPTTEHREMRHPAYHRLGESIDLPHLAAALIDLAAVVERAAPVLAAHHARGSPLGWDTPLGRVRVASTRDERHSGEFALLIDPGGNDDYRDLGRSALRPGQVTVVIDLAGNDEVGWENVPGPGAGLLGIALWADLAGNDRYEGSNLGLGTGRLGAGLLWDAAGDDVYAAGSGVLGSGEYGVGVVVDGAGNDVYGAHLMGQGFGGPGGIGLQLDRDGDDRYFCGGQVPDPDPDPDRTLGQLRPHFLSLCQGYGSGLRLRNVSGGVGALVDRRGKDRYSADIFAQGGAYLFGLGVLVDGEGDDHYSCTEHCQGESLHAAAGLLADASGDDVYEAEEHAQGTGVDRAVGILLDTAGDDRYTAKRESQGAGVKRYGVGLLVDGAGADVYDAAGEAQGWAQPDLEDAPLGLLLDLGGEDEFRLPGVAPPTAEGRRQSSSGVAFDRP